MPHALGKGYTSGTRGHFARGLCVNTEGEKTKQELEREFIKQILFGEEGRRTDIVDDSRTQCLEPRRENYECYASRTQCYASQIENYEYEHSSIAMLKEKAKPAPEINTRKLKTPDFR